MNVVEIKSQLGATNRTMFKILIAVTSAFLMVSIGIATLLNLAYSSSELKNNFMNLSALGDRYKKDHWHLGIISQILLTSVVFICLICNQADLVISIRRLKELFSESKPNQGLTLPETADGHIDSSTIMKLVFDSMIIPTTLVAYLTVVIILSGLVTSRASILLLIVLSGATISAVLLYLFPILIFNKTMRLQNERYPKTRMFNWILFIAIISAGTWLCFETKKRGWKIEVDGRLTV